MKRSAVFLVGSLAAAAVIVACSSDDETKPAVTQSSSDAASASEASIDAGPLPPPKPRVLDPLGPEFVEIGDVPIDTEIDVPMGTLGFNIEVLGFENQPVTPTIVSITDPSGKTYLAGDRPATLPIELRTPTRFPSGSNSLGVPAGKWKVKLTDHAFLRVARQRTSDGKFHGGVLDLWVHVPTGIHINDLITGPTTPDTITAATAATHQVVIDFLATFFQNVKRVLDLDKGTVTFVEADTKFVRLETEAAETEAESVAKIAQKEQLGLHLLLTEFDLMETRGGVGPYGGGIYFDRAFGTTIVRVKDNYFEVGDAGATKADYPGHVPGDRPAAIAMHEAFHAWGLPHTSELVDAYDDGFTDTPVCAKADLADPIKVYDCPDSTNLMAPGLTVAIAKTNLSPHQRAVVLGTPVYHPYLPAE